VGFEAFLPKPEKAIAALIEKCLIEKYLKNICIWRAIDGSIY
jgi:hypothetical protein